MGFNKIYNKDFFLKDGHIILSKPYLSSNQSKFKKITGSRFASILNKSDYVSPVKTWAMMVNIYYEPMEELFANAGNVIEPKIKEWVVNKTGINFKQYDPKAVCFDVFKNNHIFGGIPDGEPVDDNGDFLYPSQPMLEIKTSSIDSFVFKKEQNQFVLQKNLDGSPCVKNIGEKRLKWFNSSNEIVVPKEYMFQLGLYCYLRNIEHGMFAICFLKTDDYLKPELCDVNQREIHLVNFDVNLKVFKEHIDYAENWFKRYITTGVSPKLSKEDLEWFNNEVKLNG